MYGEKLIKTYPSALQLVSAWAALAAEDPAA
jgi:hypothetical protein